VQVYVRRSVKFYLSAVGIWFVFLVIAFSLATVREIAVQPLLGEQAAHVVGTFAVIAALLAVMGMFVRRARENIRKGGTVEACFPSRKERAGALADVPFWH